MSASQAITDSSKALIMARVRDMLSARFGGDAKGLDFALSMFESSLDMVIEAIRKGGNLSKAQIALLLAKRTNSGVGALAPNARVKCATAVADLAIGTYETYAVSSTGAWPAILWTAGYLATVQTVNVWGECWIPYAEQQMIDEKVREIEIIWEKRRAQTAANICQPPASANSLESTLEILGRYERQRRMCISI